MASPRSEPSAVLDAHAHGLRAVAVLLEDDLRRQTLHRDLGCARRTVRRTEPDAHRLARAAEHAAVPARRAVAARTRVALLERARREYLLVHDADRAQARAEARRDVVRRVHDVPVAVVGERSVRPLRRYADEGQGGVEHETQPVERLLDVRAALQPDEAVVLPRVDGLLHDVHSAGHRRVRQELAERSRAVREEVAPRGLALLCVARRRQHAHEVVVRDPVQLARRAVVAASGDASVDVLEQPRRIGEERLAPAVVDSRVRQVGVLERCAALGPIGAPRHVGQEVHTVLRAQLHLVVLLAVVVIHLGGVGLQRMRAELRDARANRLVQPLRHEVVEPPLDLRLTFLTSPCCSSRASACSLSSNVAPRIPLCMASPSSPPYLYLRALLRADS